MPRMLHTMVRVLDLDRSVKFYTEALGMKVLRKWDQPQDEYTLVFLGYGHEWDTCVLELTYNYGSQKAKCYDLGSGYGHICIGVDDVKKTVAELKQKEVNVIYDDDEGFMAFITDPDGYQIELLDDRMMMEKARKMEKEQVNCQ